MANLSETMLNQKSIFEQNLAKNREGKQQERSANTYISKKKHPKDNKASKTVYNVIPLPFPTEKGDENIRLINECFKIQFDTGEPASSDSPYTKKEYFALTTLKDFKTYETRFDSQILAPEDESLVREVTNKLFDLRKYFPWFDNAINLNEKNLSQEFLSNYGGRLRINYFPTYMMMPVIELSESIHSESSGQNTSNIKKYSLFHFDKKRLIEDWNYHITAWQEKEGAKFAPQFDLVFGGPKKGTVQAYLSFTVGDEPPTGGVVETSGIIPTRISKFGFKKYIPELFASEEDGALEITPELLSQVENLYDKPNFFRVAMFERENYEKIRDILNEAYGWLREEGLEKGNNKPIDEDKIPF